MPSSAHPNAVAAVCKVVDGWDLPLVYSVQGGERIKGGETTTMSTLWSRPTRFAPVPSDVVKVHWLLRQRKGTSGKKAAFDVLKYRVENERFIADPRSGAPTAAVFDRILRRKRAMRGIMSAVRTDDESKLEPPEGLDGGWSDLDDGSESSDDEALARRSSPATPWKCNDNLKTLEYFV